jgi:PAS domain S-box-containing protein
LAKIVQFNERRAKAASTRKVFPAKRSVAAFTADAEGQYVFVNGHWSRLAGVSQLAALGQGWIESVYFDDREEVLKAWLNAVQGEQYFGLMYRLQGSKGEPRLALSQAIPQHDDNGELVGYCGTILDLSRFSNDYKTPALEQRLKPILDLLGLNYYEQDLMTGEISCSPSCSKLIHGAQTIEEFDALIHPEDLTGVNLRLSHSISESSLFEAEYRIVTRKREWIRVRDYAKIIQTEDGVPILAIGFMAPVEDFVDSREKQGLQLLCSLTF